MSRLDSFGRAAFVGLLAATQAACSESVERDGTGAEGGAPGVTSTEIVADLSLDDFTVMCNEANGVVEVHAHCGGVVSGPGFSYDSDTDALTEHTCAGVNTCTGFSCVVDD